MLTLSRYINALAEYAGNELGGFRVTAEDIASRTLSVAIPKGSMTSLQRKVIETARAQAKGLGIDLVVTPF
jgi:hypothetical protein